MDAFYVSINDKKVGRGPIKYRFMLGKDVITDYNAERNHHYKQMCIRDRWCHMLNGWPTLLLSLAMRCVVVCARYFCPTVRR